MSNKIYTDGLTINMEYVNIDKLGTNYDLEKVL